MKAENLRRATSKSATFAASDYNSFIIIYIVGLQNKCLCFHQHRGMFQQGFSRPFVFINIVGCSFILTMHCGALAKGFWPGFASAF